MTKWNKRISNILHSAGDRVFLSIKILLILIIISIKQTALHAKPFQLLTTESAVLNRKGGFETKLNYSYEFGHIPVHLLLFRFRYGIVSWFEIGANMNMAYFPEQEDYRISEIGSTLKAKLMRHRKSGVSMCSYVHYRHAYWGTYWKPVIKLVDMNRNRIRWIVSPHADGGMDFSAAILVRHTVRQTRNMFSYITGFTYTRMEGREYFNFRDNQRDLFSFNFSPECHVYKDILMVALENHVTYWHNRGVYYNIVPQLRWEAVQFWVIELGAIIPVAGASNYRIIFGFDHEFD